MLSIGSLLIDSLDYIMIVDRDYNIIYNTRYDMTLGGDGQAHIGKKYFDMYPKLKKEESSIVRCIETGEVIIRKNQRCEDYLGNTYVSNNVTLPLKKKGEFIAAVEMSIDVNLQEKDKNLANSRFDEFIKRVKEAAGKITFDTILTEDPEMKRNIEKAKVLATMPNPTLIYGETGTGKEVFAQAMINYSGVSKNNVVIQNCAAVPENLIESILFGTVKGAYTGAENRKGLFEVANGGIIFLDELNSIPFHVQAKLLRVLQDGTFRPLGSNVDKKVSVKVIGAMNIEPMTAIENNIIRKDLFYRFSSGLITLSPLRERKEDIRMFTEYYIKHFADVYDRDVAGITDELMEAFIAYEWEGNVRELMNTVEYMVTSSPEGALLSREMLPAYLKDKIVPPSNDGAVMTDKRAEIGGEFLSDGIPYYEVMEKVERDMIEKALEQAQWNKSMAAEILGMPRQTLKYRMKILNIK